MESADIENNEMPAVPELEAAKQQLPVGDALADLPTPALAIHLALTHAGGDYNKAAAALGVNKTKLKEMMRPFPQLRTRWAAPRPGCKSSKQLRPFEG